MNDHPHDKSVFLKVSKVMDDLAINDIYRVKYKDASVQHGYNFYP